MATTIFREGEPIQADELRIGHVFTKKGMTDSFTVLDDDGQSLLIQGDDEPVWQARAHHTNVKSDVAQPREPRKRALIGSISGHHSILAVHA